MAQLIALDSRSLGFGLMLPVKRSRADRVKRKRPFLTPGQIREIYFIRGTCTQVQATKFYNASQSMISRIWNRKSWKTVIDSIDSKQP